MQRSIIFVIVGSWALVSLWTVAAMRIARGYIGDAIMKAGVALDLPLSTRIVLSNWWWYMAMAAVIVGCTSIVLIWGKNNRIWLVSYIVWTVMLNAVVVGIIVSGLGPLVKI